MTPEEIASDICKRWARQYNIYYEDSNAGPSLVTAIATAIRNEREAPCSWCMKRGDDD